MQNQDEKYSYVVFSKMSVELPESRVLRHPMRKTGHVNLVLCKVEGIIKQETVSKKNRELYRQARKVEWGSPFPDESIEIE
ncbi:MAG: hypothetical protein H0W88_08710 [Parachlamydiaceae bacterium]|nr:hypothetical protein [Parachlamydiaceae bacterium]